MTNGAAGGADGAATADTAGAGCVAAGVGVADGVADAVADEDAEAETDADALGEGLTLGEVDDVAVAELLAEGVAVLDEVAPSAPWAGDPSRLSASPVTTAAVVAPSAARPISLRRNTGP